MTTLGEDLVILAVGLKPRLGPSTGRMPLSMRSAIRGAELVSLTTAGRMAVADGRITVLDPAPLGDPVLDERLSVVVRTGGMAVGAWMSDRPPGFVTAYFERLHAAGVLSAERVMALGMFKRTGYRVVDPARFQYLATQVHAAVVGPGPHNAAVTAAVHAAAHSTTHTHHDPGMGGPSPSPEPTHHHHH